MVDQVILQPCPDVDISSVRTATECISAAGDPDIVAGIEEAATQWCSQVEKVSQCIPLIFTYSLPVLVVVVDNLYFHRYDSIQKT